jgi:hypothetical protein
VIDGAVRKQNLHILPLVVGYVASEPSGPRGAHIVSLELLRNFADAFVSMHKGTLCAPIATGQPLPVAVTYGIFGKERGNVNSFKRNNLGVKVALKFGEEAVEWVVNILRIETVLVGIIELVVLRQLRPEEIVRRDRDLLITDCILEV